MKYLSTNDSIRTSNNVKKTVWCRIYVLKTNFQSLWRIEFTKDADGYILEYAYFEKQKNTWNSIQQIRNHFYMWKTNTDWEKVKYLLQEFLPVDELFDNASITLEKVLLKRALKIQLTHICWMWRVTSYSRKKNFNFVYLFVRKNHSNRNKWWRWWWWFSFISLIQVYFLSNSFLVHLFYWSQPLLPEKKGFIFLDVNRMSKKIFAWFWRN